MKMPMYPIVIWEPRYSDINFLGTPSLMIKPSRLKEGKNLILVTLGYLAGTIYEIDAQKARKCLIEESKEGFQRLIIPVSWCNVVTSQFDIEPTDAEKDGCIFIRNDEKGYCWRISVEESVLLEKFPHLRTARKAVSDSVFSEWGC